MCPGPVGFRLRFRLILWGLLLRRILMPVMVFTSLVAMLVLDTSLFTLLHLLVQLIHKTVQVAACAAGHGGQQSTATATGVDRPRRLQRSDCGAEA